MANEFPRVGARNLKVSEVESHQIDNQTYCPFCQSGPMDGVTGTRFDTVEPPSDNPWDVVKVDEDHLKPVYPEQGSPSICVYCGELCVFHVDSGKLTLAVPTEAEKDEWKKEPDLWRVLTGLVEKYKAESLAGRLRGDMRYARTKPKRF